MGLSIHTNDLPRFVSDLTKSWAVYGPVEYKTSIKTQHRFQKINHFKELSLGYGQTITPPKKYFLPDKEVLFKYKQGKISLPENDEMVIFGLSKKDGEGIFYLDKVMSKPVEEENYARRRKNIKLIVVDNLPPSNNLSCDLYLQRVDENHYQAFPYSSFGGNLIKESYFVRDQSTGTLSTRHLPDEIVFHPRLDEIVENSRNHPIWDQLAKKCLNCGICTYVCPLCYCFEIDDEIDITKDIEKDCQGCRYREWDSCMLPDFNKVTFHNFRPEPKDRIYNWYYHKFVRMPREYGFSGCIDCGRCVSYCPANINFREVLKELIEDDSKQK
jgi:sulfhydrogenase subunit beta (sulfur reductase)